MDDANVIALKTHLQAFVPLQIALLERSGGINDKHINWAQSQLETIVFETDVLFNGCAKPGQAAKLAGILTNVCAILSLTTPFNRKQIEDWMRIEREERFPAIPTEELLKWRRDHND